MLKIIQWCNENSGFIAMLQTIITAVISVCAIIVTVRVACMPYKVDLRIYSGLCYGKDGKYKMEIHLANIGNLPLYLKGIDIGIMDQNGRQEILALGYLNEISSEKRFLASQMMESFEIPLRIGDEDEIDKENTRIVIRVMTEQRDFEKLETWAFG